MSNKLKGLAAGILSELRSESNKGEGTYVADAATKPLSIDNYKVSVIPTRYGSMKKVNFEVDGQAQPFSFRVKGNRDIDEDSPVSIQRFVAARDYETTNGGIVKAGTVAWMAIQ